MGRKRWDCRGCEDRRRLAEALFDSVPRDSDEEIAAAWRGEVLGRIEELRGKNTQTESYADVKARLHEALKTRR